MTALSKIEGETLAANTKCEHDRKDFSAGLFCGIRKVWQRALGQLTGVRCLRGDGMDKTHIYLGEIQTQITFAKRAFEEYLRALATSDIPSVFMRIIFLFTPQISTSSSTLTHSFRGQHLASLFFGNIIDLKQFRRLRNHLEHFDERLDAWVKNFSGHAFFDMNIVTGAKGFPTKAFLRAMDGYIFRFHGEDYDLQALHSEVEKLAQFLDGRE